MISNKMIYDLNKLPFFQQNVLYFLSPQQAPPPPPPIPLASL